MYALLATTAVVAPDPEDNVTGKYGPPSACEAYHVIVVALAVDGTKTVNAAALDKQIVLLVSTVAANCTPSTQV